MPSSLANIPGGNISFTFGDLAIPCFFPYLPQHSSGGNRYIHDIVSFQSDPCISFMKFWWRLNGFVGMIANVDSKRESLKVDSLRASSPFRKTHNWWKPRIPKFELSHSLTNREKCGYLWSRRSWVCCTENLARPSSMKIITNSQTSDQSKKYPWYTLQTEHHTTDTGTTYTVLRTIN